MMILMEVKFLEMVASAGDEMMKSVPFFSSGNLILTQIPPSGLDTYDVTGLPVQQLFR